MNKTVSAPSVGKSEPLKIGSPELEALLNQIAEGASDRERDRVLPFEVIELSKKVTSLKMATLVINLAILGYLIWAKRLFGVGRLRKPKNELGVEDVKKLFGPGSRGTPFVRERPS